MGYINPNDPPLPGRSRVPPHALSIPMTFSSLPLPITPLNGWSWPLHLRWVTVNWEEV